MTDDLTAWALYATLCVLVFWVNRRAERRRKRLLDSFRIEGALITYRQRQLDKTPWLN